MYNRGDGITSYRPLLGEEEEEEEEHTSSHRSNQPIIKRRELDAPKKNKDGAGTTQELRRILTRLWDRTPSVGL
jgi:hypothetical protein